MPDRPARTSRICWADLVLLLPMLLLLPFAAITVPLAAKSAVACFSGDSMNCRYAAAPLAQAWYHLKGLGFGLGAVGGGLAVLVVAVTADDALRRQRRLSRLLGAGLLAGLLVAAGSVAASIGNNPAAWRSWGTPVFMLSFTLLPAIVAARHLPRVLRAGFPQIAVPSTPRAPHVQ